jgi:hypothetical protein
MKNFFILLLLLLFPYILKSQIYMEETEYMKTTKNFFNLSIDSLEKVYSSFFYKENPEILKNQESYFLKFTIKLDSLGCISKIQSFPKQNLDTIMMEKICVLIKKHYSCKLLIYKDENGKDNFIEIIYLTIIFNNSEIKIGIS